MEKFKIIPIIMNNHGGDDAMQQGSTAGYFLNSIGSNSQASRGSGRHVADNGGRTSRDSGQCIFFACKRFYEPLMMGYPHHPDSIPRRTFQG